MLKRPIKGIFPYICPWIIFDMCMNKQRTLLVKFKNEISQWELPLFRGAVIASMEHANILFHNHIGDNYRYSYPLIQYKRISKHPSIVCINEGADVIGEFFNDFPNEVTLSDKSVNLEIGNVKASTFLIQIWDSSFVYTICKWLPFNQKNYAEFSKLAGTSERTLYMERILTGNILSMAKGLGITFEKHVEVKITKLEDMQHVVHKGVKMQSYDVEFITNVSLPNYIGLGKGVSMGYGMVVRI